MTLLEAERDVSEAPMGSPEPSEGDDDLDHIVCHCTKNNISWCKLDVSDDEFYDEELPAENPCPLCMLALEESEETGVCPWGCGCKNCGPTDDEDDDPPESGMRGLSIVYMVIDEAADWSPPTHQGE